MPNPVYNKVIERADLGGEGSVLLPTQYSNEIIKAVPQASVLMTRGRHVTMSSKKRSQPVLNLFPTAYWVDGDTGIKQTTEAQWKGLNMVAEELAVIIPVPEAIIEDTTIDVFGEITPSAIEAFGIKIDEAGIWGVDKPATWEQSVYAGAVAAGNTVTVGTGVDLADDIALMGEKMAEEGYSINGFASQPGLQWKLRRLRTTDGDPIYQTNLSGAGTSGIYGLPTDEVKNGSWDTEKAMMMAADWSNFIVGIRQDMTFKWLDQAVISDADGKVILNLAQQDCVALRLVMRVGFCIANPVNRVQPTEGSRFPAMLLVNP